MSFFADLRIVVWLKRLESRVSGIETQLSRIADVLEGREPAAKEVPAETDVTRHTPLSDDTYLEIERIEAHYQKVHGRPPTAEEVQKELDGEEWDASDLPPASRARLGL